MSQNTGISVVALSQMTRPAPKSDGTYPEPTMHNLRESGQLEQDADVIMLLYRLDQNNIKAQRRLAIPKNKEGEIGRFTLDFDGKYQQFSLADEPDERAKMPAPRGKTHRTPVLSEMQQESYYEISGEDEKLPF